jgi:hypothetical protein
MQEREELRALKREIKMSRERKVKEKNICMYGKERKKEERMKEKKKREERKKEEWQERYEVDESSER